MLPMCGANGKLCQLKSIADVTGAHINLERHDEKLLVIIRLILLLTRPTVPPLSVCLYVRHTCMLVL